jgi:hypothetical protein
MNTNVWDFFDVKLYINLGHRIDRYNEFITESGRVGLIASRVEGVLEENRILGFNKSQRLALERCTGSRNLIVEDDVIFHDAPHFNDALKQLPDDWDILYLGANIVGTDLCSWPTPEYFSPFLRRVTQAWTTHAVAYSKKAVQKILSTWDFEGGQIYDDWLRCNIENMQTFIVNPMFADQRIGYSDIWQRDTDYGFVKQGNERMAANQPAL